MGLGQRVLLAALGRGGGEREKSSFCEQKEDLAAFFC
jgi:hypothetical protein